MSVHKKKRSKVAPTHKCQRDPRNLEYCGICGVNMGPWQETDTANDMLQKMVDSVKKTVQIDNIRIQTAAEEYAQQYSAAIQSEIARAFVVGAMTQTHMMAEAALKFMRTQILPQENTNEPVVRNGQPRSGKGV